MDGRCEPGEHSLHSSHANLQFYGCLVDSCQVDSKDSSFSWSLTRSPSQEFAIVRCPGRILVRCARDPPISRQESGDSHREGMRSRSRPHQSEVLKANHVAERHRHSAPPILVVPEVKVLLKRLAVVLVEAPVSVRHREPPLFDIFVCGFAHPLPRCVILDQLAK